MLVSVTYAVIDEDAVVVVLGDASLANTAMFRASWFEGVTSTALVAWKEDREIVRVECHVARKVLGIDVARIADCRDI